MLIDLVNNHRSISNENFQRALAVGSTVVRQRNLKEDQKKLKRIGKGESTEQSSKVRKFLKQSDLMNEKDTNSNSEDRKYECGVCSFVCYNRNDFQVFLVIIWVYENM